MVNSARGQYQSEDLRADQQQEHDSAGSCAHSNGCLPNQQVGEIALARAFENVVERARR